MFAAHPESPLDLSKHLLSPELWYASIDTVTQQTHASSTSNLQAPYNRALSQQANDSWQADASAKTLPAMKCFQSCAKMPEK